MRILVTSDTHGNSSSLRRAILAQPTAEVVIHLGDGEGDVARMRFSFPEKTILQVRGNGDWGSSLPTVGVYEAAGKRIFYTHGHLYGVKSGTYELLCAGRDRGADIVLFGHTHNALERYEDGIYLLNPGSLSGWRPSYGTIDITDQGVLTNVVELPL